MQPTLCSRCKKNVAVIFITRIENGESHNEGLCLRCARELFLACGVPMDEASSRCMLLYAYVFGVSLMIYEKFDTDVARLKRDIADLIARSLSVTPNANAA